MSLIELAAKYRLAYLSGSRETAAAGGLVSLSANFVALYERAALARGRPEITRLAPSDGPSLVPARAIG